MITGPQPDNARPSDKINQPLRLTSLYSFFKKRKKLKTGSADNLKLEVAVHELAKP